MIDQTRLSLLERVRETSTGESWTEFIEVYGPLIRGWLVSQGVQQQDADDVQQEVLTMLAEKISTFRHNGRRGAFRTWLRRVTVNRLRQHWQARQRNPGAHAGPDLSELAHELADDTSRITLFWDKQHDRFVLEHLLKTLENRFQQKSMSAFRQIVLLERPAREVALELGMSLGSVRVAQHRILRALQDCGRGILD